jgi:hypothetical protein
MEDWIDIVKERLQDAQATLLPNDWEEFEASSLPVRRPRALRWLIPGLAVAAGLAAVLLLQKPEHLENEGQPVVAPPVSQVLADDVTEDAIPSAELLPTTSVVRVPKNREAQPVRDEAPATKTNQAVPSGAMETPVKQAIPDTADRQHPAHPSTGIPETPTESPFIPLRGKDPQVNLKVAAAAGGIVGTGLLTALIVPLTAGKSNTVPPYIRQGSLRELLPNGHLGGGTVFPIGNDDTGHTRYDLLKESTHYFPLQVGLSTRIPLSEQLSFTTGLTYSLYCSKYTMTVTRDKWQRVHYLGIPIRLDRTIVSTDRFDVYAGGGFLGDICLKATLPGANIPTDRPSLSLIGAGGIQMNATKRLGFYIEPELSWRIPARDYPLVTYRSEHPVMVSVTAGIRFNLFR